MSDEKDIKKEDKQEVVSFVESDDINSDSSQKEASKKEADFKAEEVKTKEVSKKENLKINFESEKEDLPKNESQLEELPEEIRKKLETRKAEKSKKAKGKKKKKKEDRKVSSGNAYVKATYNNTTVTLTDTDGNVLSWASAGVAGFKGAKKSTPYAASIITRIATEKAKEDYGLKEVNVFVKGVGTGRESAVRALNANGLNVLAIKDITPIPHNGCRPKKPRRV